MSTPVPYTAQEVAAVRAGAAAGLNDPQIAEREGIPRGRVRGIRDKLNIASGRPIRRSIRNAAAGGASAGAVVSREGDDRFVRPLPDWELARLRMVAGAGHSAGVGSHPAPGAPALPGSTVSVPPVPGDGPPVRARCKYCRRLVKLDGGWLVLHLKPEPGVERAQLRRCRGSWRVPDAAVAADEVFAASASEVSA